MNNLIKKIYACEKEKNSVGTIANALLWASVILAVSWLTRGAENASTINLITLLGASSTFLFTNRQQKNK